MRQLILSLLFSSLLCAQEYNARVTYYWTHHNKTSTGVKPKAGRTIAVDPKIIPYGSKVHIPEMGKTYLAQNTGPWVVSKKASKGKTIVVDIYCRTKAEADALIKKYPAYMKIKVEKPNAKTN
jgi:3D (Asp-Asp-Asp) domain-containing protein